MTQLEAIYNSSMNQDGWRELSTWYPESARDCQNLEHFLTLVDSELKTRRGRLQNALGLQHFILTQETSGLFMLAKSGIWLAIPPIASSVFRIASEGVYLSEHPNRITDFVDFGWYETYKEREPRPIEEDGIYADIAEQLKEDEKSKFDKLRPTYQKKTSWHDHDVDSLAESVGMAYLLPIYHSTTRLAKGTTIGFMSRGKGGRLWFDRHRENTTPVMEVGSAFVMVCHSMYHFYKAVLGTFEISNETILQVFEIFRSMLAGEHDGCICTPAAK